MRLPRSDPAGTRIIMTSASSDTAKGQPVLEVRQLEAAMEVGNLAWWAMDCHTGAVRFHRKLTDMLGYAAGLLERYADFTALIHPDDLQPTTQAMRDHLSGKATEYKADYRIRTRSGAYLWFQDVGRISDRDDAGRPVAVTGVVLDISERKRVEDGLRESEERFRRLFHGHSASKLIIDPDTGQIIDANDAAAVFYGWSIDELKQMQVQQINDLPPEEVKVRMATAASAHKTRFEFRHRRADGSVRDVEVFCNTIAIMGRALLYSIIHDVTETRQAEESLRRTHDRLQHAERVARFGHWEFSLGDKIIHASAGALQVYGFTHGDIPLSTIQSCALPEHRARLDAALSDLVEQRKAYDMEYEIRRVSDGKIAAVHSKAEYDAATRRVFGIVQDITQRKLAQAERENLILQLQSAVEHIKTLKGIVPICAHCKKIRDDKGYWQQVEAYVARHTEAQFSHGICPDCEEKFFPGL
jgi:PAS domain S-box-containing protein